MSCNCGYADECDGETAVFHPLQAGGMCSVASCKKPWPFPPYPAVPWTKKQEREYQTQQRQQLPESPL